MTRMNGRAVGPAALIAMVAAGAVSTAAHAELTTIDDFNFTHLNDGAGWQVDLGSDVGNPPDISDNAVIYETDLSGVVGGSRWINTVTQPRESSPGGPLVNWGVSGALSTWSGPDYDGAYFLSTAWGGVGESHFRYDADGAGLGIAMNAAGVIGLDMYVDHLGNGIPSVISFTISDGSSSHTSQMIWDELIEIQEWIEIDFELSAFADAGVDLNNVQSIELSYYGDLANDMALDRIYADVLIPAPSALALLCVGCIGGRSRRRR